MGKFVNWVCALRGHEWLEHPEGVDVWRRCSRCGHREWLRVNEQSLARLERMLREDAAKEARDGR